MDRTHVDVAAGPIKEVGRVEDQEGRAVMLMDTGGNWLRPGGILQYAGDLSVIRLE
jgi:hypothetical protein